MKTISVKQHFDEDIKRIWTSDVYKDQEHLKPLIERGYWLQDKMPLNALLFVGINPSFSGEEIFPDRYYDLEQESNFYLKYHKPFEVIAKQTNEIWTHHDLLFFRETKQMKPQGDVTIQFFKDQLAISEKIIRLAKPKMIIVTNATARDYMQGKGGLLTMNFEFEFSSELGTYVFTGNEDLNGTPVFFTSMLSGQRALDIGSRERLIWHIQFVLKNIAR